MRNVIDADQQHSIENNLLFIEVRKNNQDGENRKKEMPCLEDYHSIDLFVCLIFLHFLRIIFVLSISSYLMNVNDFHYESHVETSRVEAAVGQEVVHVYDQVQRVLILSISLLNDRDLY